MGQFISKCLNRKRRSVVFLGAPGSEKSSIIKLLRNNKDVFKNCMYQEFTLRRKGYTIDAYDVSEDERHINFWKFYFENCYLAVFVINISDESKIAESKDVFERFFTSYGLNKEHILFLLTDGTVGKEKPEENGENEQNTPESLQDTSEMVNLFLNEYFVTIPGLNKKVLGNYMVVSAETSQDRILSYICKNLRE